MNIVANTTDTSSSNTIASSNEKVKRPRVVPNQHLFHSDGSVSILVTSKGQRIEFLIDGTDYDRVSQHWWSVAWRGGNPYLVARIDGKQVYLHRWLTQAEKGKVDHENRDTRDNRCRNLRAATDAGNCQNSSLRKNNRTGFLGVHRTADGKYRAQICAFGKRTSLGVFSDSLTAAIVRDLEAVRLHGEFASLNFPSVGRAIENAVRAKQQLDEKVAA